MGEFRSAWHPGAQSDLRQVVKELVELDELRGSRPGIADPEDLSCKVDSLLQQPFDKALTMLPALRDYVEGQEDAAAVMEEFRAAWHPEASAELRQVLEEIIDPAAAAASAAATEEFMKNPTAALPIGGIGSSVYDDMLDSDSDPRGLQFDAGAEERFSDSDSTRQLRGMPSDIAAEEEEDQHRADLDAAVDGLLRRRFDEVLRDFPALREHITLQDDAKDVELEFRQSWSPEAPEALRLVLEELLDPAAAAANAKETTAFMSSMESFSREAMGASGAAMAATVGSVDGPERLRSKL